MTDSMTRAVLLGVVLVLAQQQPPPQPRPPVFRAGAHHVRVDAYPTNRDGTIVTGLTKEDFEVYEDGRLQDVERAEFVAFDTWTPEGERKDPRTQQDAYDLAADPNWRLFVIVIDPAAYGMEGQHYLRTPLHNFLERSLGPRDLFGLVTTEDSWTDLTLGQTVSAANAVLDSRKWIYRDDSTDERWLFYYQCHLEALIPRKKLDDTFALFEGLVKLLGAIRQEKKSIVFVSEGLSLAGTTRTRTSSTSVPSGIPGVPTAPPGAPGPGPRIRPPSGGGGGPAGPMAHGDRIATPSRQINCDAERMRLDGIDFAERFRDLLRDARASNVAFYPVSPLGLPTIPFKPEGGADLDAFRRMNTRADTLKSLASETDGVAIVNTNDLAGGLRRVANDLRAYYVLGYYTNNTKWDGGVRSIKVRLKPKHDVIRARKQYRAPTMEEIAALTPSPAPKGPSAAEKAFGELARPESSAVVSADGPFLFRNGVPATRFVCARTDKVRVEWLAPSMPSTMAARLLDRHGNPLPVPLTVRENGLTEPHRAVVEFSLAPLARGDYLVELSSAVEGGRKLVALRIE